MRFTSPISGSDPIRLIGPALFDLMILVVLFAYMICGDLDYLFEQDPAMRSPISDFGTVDNHSEECRLIVDLTWNRDRTRSKIRVRWYLCTLGQFRLWLYPRANLKINPHTKYSEIPLCIRAPGDMPFSEIRKILDVCADKDIQIYKVFLETT